MIRKSFQITACGGGVRRRLPHQILNSQSRLSQFQLQLQSLSQSQPSQIQSQLQFQSQSFSTRKKLRASKPCPFAALRIPKKSTYKTAKKTFLKIAMNNHPDVLNQRLDESSPNYKKEMEDAVDKFRKARTAFESLVEDDEGMCMLRVEAEAMDETMMNDEQFDAWFMNETGKSNPYQFDLDPATMREVAAATETMGGGLDRDGGMWTLATMVSNSVKNGKEAGSTLRLEAGAISEDADSHLNMEGTLRRRRRHTRKTR